MITEEELKKIAKLAKFQLTQEELDMYANQLSNIMEMIDIFKEIDCDNVEPLTSVCPMGQRMRKDEVETCDISEQLFANLPEEKAGLVRKIKCYVVPKVVE
ncbi:Asp-tRNA(Asn)/Glu-tRNA(Gln) amidotransferase subunit GatC [Candidatus Tisiphia endosymbiont of Nemotelus uliginosus]|uniref:Asp-tRNA(Asn)/Glu-tRNA(Gln) amidotransferase subunit GatC n=1 Tax=Candidatus Tisiphia endosymbiont of Nemotelus uliginosus TaxID=3077926 RepID=UPI0035C88F1B